MVRQYATAFGLCALFASSGAAALIYEIVWFQQLTLVLGATSISLGLLLGSFMAGMCLGSLTWTRWAPRAMHPLRIYAALELGIAAFGVLSLWLVPAVQGVYGMLGSLGAADLVARSVLIFSVLIVPTFLMGATLPAVARWVEASDLVSSWLGRFYGCNTLGAVVGTVLAGFWLLPWFDVIVATWVAIGINLAVAAGAWALVRGEVWNGERMLTSAGMVESADSAASSAHEARYDWVWNTLLCLVTASSGLTAMAAEVIWTRLLGLLFGATAYTFSLLLAVFLTGLGLGSGIGAIWGRRARSPGHALAWCQLGLVVAIPWGQWIICSVLPYWLGGRVGEQTMLDRSGIDFVRASVAMLPAALLWGASFPLAVAAGQRQGLRLDQWVGRLYAWNTVGGIAGSLLATFVLMPVLGSRVGMQSLFIVAAISGCGLLVFQQVGFKLLRRWPAGAGTKPTQPAFPGWLGVGVAIAMTVGLVPFVPGPPDALLAFGRVLKMWDRPQRYLYRYEGVDATIAVSEMEPGQYDFHVSAKCVASNDWADRRTERMLAHLPLLAHPHPRTVLVVGCGAGITAGTLLRHPEVERVVICEIERAVPEAAHEYFADENLGVVKDPRTQVVIDDARHYLATTTEKFDVITTDPIHPWVRGAAAVYTAEFFQQLKDHLHPGGVVAQWIPFYESSAAAVQCELATFDHVFPDASIWTTDPTWTGYDVVLLATDDGRTIPRQLVSQRMMQQFPVWQSLAQIQLGSPDLLERVYVGRTSDLQPWLAEAPLNLDINLRLQYLAGLAPDSQKAPEIFQAVAQTIARERDERLREVAGGRDPFGDDGAADDRDGAATGIQPASFEVEQSVQSPKGPASTTR